MTLVHDYDPVAEGHRLNLIVRHIDHRGIELLVKAGDLASHLHAKLGVQIRERLIEQEYLGLSYDCSSQGYPLPLTARELSWRSIKEVIDAEYRGRVTDARVDLVFWRAAQA